MNRDELLQRLREICYNPEGDVATLDEWSSLNVQELRTVVGILDNGGAAMIFESIPPRVRGHCYLLRELVRHLQRNPTNPLTGAPLTQRQRDLIGNAYFRLTGQQANIRPIATAAQRRPHPRMARNPPPRFSVDISSPRPTNRSIPATPLAPRLASRHFFPGNMSASLGRQQPSVSATPLSINSEMRQQFQGTTTINVNGQRHTASAAVLSIVRRRINGRDEFTINIEYPRRDQ